MMALAAAMFDFTTAITSAALLCRLPELLPSL